MHKFFLAACALAVVLVGPVGVAAPQTPPDCPCNAGPIPIRTMGDLVRRNRAELEALFRSAEVGPVPSGFVPARAIFNPGSRLTVPASRVIHVLWQGKIFQDDGIMVNRVFGIRAIHARIYQGVSWLDGQPAIILDYCGTSRLFPNVHDEVRQVSPGLYLGLTYTRRDYNPEPAVFFALDARPR